MKRILCAMLTAVLVLALCAPANAEAYIHPEVGFHLTIPEGWIAVDSTNVEDVMASDRVSAEMAAVMASIRSILDSTYCVFLFKADVVQPPFVNIGVEYKGNAGVEITLDDLLATVQAYEAYYLESEEQFPSYTVTVSAGAGPVEDWYPLGYLEGVYKKSGYRIALAQIFIAAGADFYEFTLTAQENDVADASTGFGELVGSFIAP